MTLALNMWSICATAVSLFSPTTPWQHVVLHAEGRLKSPEHWRNSLLKAIKPQESAAMTYIWVFILDILILELH